MCTQYEIQLLIDRHQVAFILCGSSARQLKGHSVNLLGGRAWIYNFMPLTSAEIQNPNLLHMLQYGLLPRHYLAGSQEEWFQHVEAYIHLYLTEEVKNEGLVRNLSSFVKFLDVVGFSQGELVSFSNISRETGVSKNTAQSYFQILVDTMMGYFLEPYAKTIKRTLIQEMPKFYLFDIGIANVLARRSVTALKGDAAGKAFEHFIFMELIAYNRLKKKRFEMYYWRTKSGYEVDFVLGDAQVAIEVKISDQVHKSDFKGLIAFKEDYPHTRAIVVSQDLRPRKIVIEDKAITLEVLPWLDFVRELWVGGVI